MTTLTATAPADIPIVEDYFINMGPQHPSTHGVLRLVVKLAGETLLGDLVVDTRLAVGVTVPLRTSSLGW